MGRKTAWALGLVGALSLGCHERPLWPSPPRDEPTEPNGQDPPKPPPQSASQSRLPQPGSGPLAAATNAPVSSPLAGASAAVTTDVPLSRSARMLAGLGIDPPPGVAPETAAIQRRRVPSALADYEARVGVPMRQWAASHLSPVKGETVFYPFSGPDFITVHRLYPDASRYVLVALQEGGAPPVLEAMSDRSAAAMLNKHAIILENFAERGFFVTKAMGLGFVVTGIWRGIAGTLMAFAAHEGFEVVAATPIAVRVDGSDVEPLPSEPRDAADWSSLRLTLRRGDQIVLLDYLDLDLSDDSLLSRPASTHFLERASSGKVVIKAASHLLQWPSFSLLRALLLERSQEIVQDETGLRYADLQAHFEVRLFGRFVAVNPLFDGRPQLGLRLAYQERADVEPLGFPIGYRKAGGPCLQVARRR